MSSIAVRDVCVSRTGVYGNRSYAASGGAKDASNDGNIKLARFMPIVERMRNASKKKGSILMEYLVVLFGMTALVLYFANSFYSFSGTVATSDPRVNPAGFYADAGEVTDVSMNADTNRLFHGIHFVRFYQRTMGGIALPVP